MRLVTAGLHAKRSDAEEREERVMQERAGIIPEQAGGTGLRTWGADLPSERSSSLSTGREGEHMDVHAGKLQGLGGGKIRKLFYSR